MLYEPVSEAGRLSPVPPVTSLRSDRRWNSRVLEKSHMPVFEFLQTDLVHFPDEIP